MSVAVCLLLSSFAAPVVSPRVLPRLTRAGSVPRLGMVADSALPLSLSPLILSMYINRNTNFSHQRN
jgi:hypothetical protein